MATVTGNIKHSVIYEKLGSLVSPARRPLGLATRPPRRRDPPRPIGRRRCFYRGIDSTKAPHHVFTGQDDQFQALGGPYLQQRTGSVHRPLQPHLPLTGPHAAMYEQRTCLREYNYLSFRSTLPHRDERDSPAVLFAVFCSPRRFPVILCCSLIFIFVFHHFLFLLLWQ